MVSQRIERRGERRLRFSWPLWYLPACNGEDEGYSARLEQARMVDLSSTGACFLVSADEQLWPGQSVPLRFTTPRLRDGRFAIEHVCSQVRVIRVEHYGGAMKRVAVRFDRPLDFQPAAESCMPNLEASC